MAKYLNSTGVSLLWNKIKELILDKIASIVPFVYVSLDDNELSDSQKLHNLHMFNDDNEYHHPKYIIFCRNGSIIFEGLGTKLYISDDELSYISIDTKNAKCNVEFDANTGNLKFINSENYYSIGEIIGVTDSSFQDRDKLGIKNEKRGLILNTYYGINFPWLFNASDVFYTVYLSKYRDTLLTTDEKLSNYKLVNFLREQKYYGELSKTLVNCFFKNHKDDPYEKWSLGWIQDNYVYVPDFNKSVFELYRIRETDTIKMHDVPFADATKMWNDLDENGRPSSTLIPFVYGYDDKKIAYNSMTNDIDYYQIAFCGEPGKEAIYTQYHQFKTLPTGGKAGQVLFCKGHGKECGFIDEDSDGYIDAEWQDNFEQTLGNGLVINVPLFAIDEIDTAGGYVLNSSNNFQDDIDGFEEISLDIWSSSFKPSYEYDKYLSRVNILLNNDFGSFDEWLLYEITFKNGTNGTITCETSDKTISFNAGETKELAWNTEELGSMFIHEGTWTLKLKGIKYIYNKFNYIDKINENLDNDGFIDINLFNTIIYSNLKDAISNITPKSELDETYADKTLVTTINNKLYDQVPVKISYADGNIIFESESQKIAFPMANSYTTYDQYVTGFATGDLNIQQGAAIVPVDKNGRFKRVFPYDTTTSMPSFNSCREVTYIDMSRFDTKKITSMRNTFKDCSNLTYLNISGWDISNVTGPTDFIFYGCSKLKHIDVSNWDTSGSTDMNSIFSGCTVLEDIDVSNWDTSNVVDMRNMFQGCYALKELNVSNWNIAKVTNFSYTFGYTNIETLDLSSWQNDVVTNLAGMFKGCKITSLNLSGFNTANVTTMAEMFTNCRYLKELNLSNWNVSKVTTMESMFVGCNKLQSINFGNNWNMDKVIKTTNMLTFCDNLTTVTGTISNLKKSLNLIDSPLTNESAMVFINGIAENGNGVTITFKKSTYDTLTAEQKAIATNKGATIDYF